MSIEIARVTEISSQSTESFDDAIAKGVKRATETLRNVKGAWVKEQSVHVENDQIARYQVNLQVTFVLE